MMKRKSRIEPLLMGRGFCFALASTVLLATGSAAAQSTLPQPILTTVHPCVAQVGTTVAVTITGTELGGATRLHFSTAGIECQPGGKPGQFNLVIGKDVPVGYYDVRAVTPYGISNPRVLAITRLGVAELKPGVKVRAGQVFLGRAVKQDRTRVTFDAKQREPIQILCEAKAVDSRMEPVLSVRDANEAVVARLQAGEPFLFSPAAGGTYTLEIHDLMFRGDAEHPFLLVLSKPGASGLERPFPLNPAESQDVDPTKPVPIEDVTTAWFAARSRPRLFTFSAKKDEVRILEVKCARLGLNADPTLSVERVDGDKITHIAEAQDRPVLAGKDEFDPGWADPMLRLVVKEDGVYRVKVRNIYPTRVPFELSVRPPGVAFELVAIPSEPPPPAAKTAASIIAAPLWRGGLATLKVTALRERGFTGPITLSAEGLPPGVVSLGGLVPEGKDVGYMTFSADAKAESWGGAVRIKGEGGGVSVIARGATIIRATPNTAREAVYTRLTQEVPLGVVAADAPVQVEAEVPLQEVAADGKLSVPLKITRSAAFAEGFKLTALGLGPPATAPAATIAAKATNGKLDLDIAKLKLAKGDHPIVLQTTAKFTHKPSDDPKAKPKEVTAVIHSKPFTIRVK